MPLPPVVIELAPADAASEHAPSLIAACSESVAEGDCTLGGAGVQEPRAVAIVSWHDERSSRIEVGVRHGREVRWVERELHFGPDDPARERWRSVGLVISTLVGEAEAEIVREQPPRAEPRAPRPEPPTLRVRRDVVAPPPLLGWVGVDAALGPALDDGSLRAGGGFGGGVRIVSPLFGMGALRYSVRPENDGLLVDWLTIAIGLSARIPASESFAVDVNASPMLERIHAAASAGGRTESGSRWLTGARVGAGGTWTMSHPWGLALGLDLEWRAGSTAISLAGRGVGSSPTLTYVVTLGARFSLF